MVSSKSAEVLDVLESWVLKLFGDVKSGVALKHEFKSGIPIWKTGKLYRLEAVKDIHMLDLSWTLPSLRKDYMKKSEDYLAHLLGHGNVILAYIKIDYSCFFHRGTSHL